MARPPLLSGLLIVAAGLVLSSCTSPARSDWQLVWSDEFARDGRPDPTKWDYNVGGDGWGNRELQYYTASRPENARVEGGRLIIEARREPFGGKSYTSARLVTRGRAEWRHGRVEVRARLPVGRGSWPAIWMLPVKWDLGNGQWPDNGEIDIMEHVGYDPGVVHGSLHSQLHQWRANTQRTATVRVPDATEQFHVYALEWEPGEVRLLVDGQEYFRARDDGRGWESWPFERPFYLILNLAVGGDWGGTKGVDDTAFPQRFEIDYVRVYQRPPASGSPRS